MTLPPPCFLSTFAVAQLLFFFSFSCFFFFFFFFFFFYFFFFFFYFILRYTIDACLQSMKNAGEISDVTF